MAPIVFPTEPTAAPEAVVRAPHARFTVLTPRLLRLEHSPTDAFEDRASQVIWHRRQPVPAFEVKHERGEVEIITTDVHLRYRPGPAGFRRRSLSITLSATGHTWHFGDRDPHNLLGTARTLDRADGPVPLPPGLMSRAGWSLIDDSATLVFGEQGWLAPRAAPDNLDLYFLGYGHDYLACLQDYTRLAGRIPLIPRWSLGNWWSRYWEYSQDELMALMSEFRARGIPLAVCIVDMDWHITESGNECTGWTGYTWNEALFPDPEGFLQWLHAQGLRTALNLHPAEGIHPHEAAYPEMSRRLGLDPAGGEPVPFDIAAPEFAEAYFEVLHHPLEQQGVDFWWLDWQQGEHSRLVGLDPLWWLNHLHFADSGRDLRRRPFIFSRWGGLGNHRYPIGFSGDTVVGWTSLAFQPYFTATAANVACAWWSHDIGGHMLGVEEPELYLRWVQWGVFSPILRLHSTKNPFQDRRPWGYDAEILRLARDALQLRHALIPYLYSMAWQTTQISRPPVLPMYYRHPEEEAAYRCPQQYYFGSQLLVAPYVARRDPATRLSRQTIWLPPGQWFDFHSGERYAGGRRLARHGGLEDVPVYAPAGAIVPLAPHTGWGGLSNPEELEVLIFPGGDGEFELYEDDGESQDYLAGHYAVTRLRQGWREDALTFTIERAAGDQAVLPASRVYRLLVRGVGRPDEIEGKINGERVSLESTYDDVNETLAAGPLRLSPADEARVVLRAATGALLAGRDRRPDHWRRMLRAFRLESEAKARLDRELPALLSRRLSLQSFANALQGAQVEALRSVLENADQRRSKSGGSLAGV